jgi:hypothetical protein
MMSSFYRDTVKGNVRVFGVPATAAGQISLAGRKQKTGSICITLIQKLTEKRGEASSGLRAWVDTADGGNSNTPSVCVFHCLYKTPSGLSSGIFTEGGKTTKCPILLKLAGGWFEFGLRRGKRDQHQNIDIPSCSWMSVYIIFATFLFVFI